MIIGPDVGQGLLDGDVAVGRHQRVLQPVALRAVVVDIVGGNQGRTGLAGQRRQFPVAGRILLEEILLEFQVHPVRAVPVLVFPQQPLGVAAAALRQRPGQRAAAPAGEQDHPFGVFR